jgi:hypothetical protein
MSDKQIAKKVQQDVKARAEIIAAREKLTRRGVLVDSGEKRLNPKTGRWEIVWMLSPNPELKTDV